MKPINLKTSVNLILAGAAAALLAACTSAEPQVIVVTATPTATPQVVTVTPQPTPVVELSVKPAAAVEAGALLRGNGEAVFYVTAAGTRQHIADSETLGALGFAERDIVNVADEALQALPAAGELTRLVYDDQDNLYWVAEGRRWPVNEWKKVVERADYAGLSPTHLDRSLAAALPVRAGFKEGMLLRAGSTVYYFSPEALIPVQGGVSSEAAVLDVPAEMVGAYARQTQLAQAVISLKTDTPAANVRQSPSLQAEVIGTVQNPQKLTAQGRTADNAWLQIVYQGQAGWLAADLVVEGVAWRLLPAWLVEPVAADLPQAEPAAVVEVSTPQPLFCTDVPIRGFGQVWSGHPEVKNTLGCADSWQGGEQATAAAVQTFQNGLMVWLQADGYYSGDPVYVFFNDGSYQRFGDLGPADPAKVGATPVGYFEVGDKFSKVYWEGTGAQVRERLGYAISPAKDSAGAFQNFSNGRMFWAEVLDRIFVIYEYGYFEGNTYIQVRTWHSYEDTF